jgi:mono/diheme cytochrome c family protein
MRLLIFGVYAALLLVCGRAQSSHGKQEYLARCAGCHGEDGTAEDTVRM